MSNNNSKSFDSLADLAIQQRQTYNDIHNPKQIFLQEIEKALMNRQLPDRAEIIVETSVSDDVLRELLNNKALMQELSVYLKCKKCNENVRPMPSVDMYRHHNMNPIRLCKQCYSIQKANQ